MCCETGFTKNVVTKLKGWVLGGTPLYDLNGDVRPDRVWCSVSFLLNGVSISLICVCNRVSLQDLMYPIIYINFTISRLFTSFPMFHRLFYQFASIVHSCIKEGKRWLNVLDRVRKI